MRILKLLSWNVNGIRAIHKKGFLEWLNKESPDILCLQETKAHEEQLVDELKNVEGYQSYFCSGERKGYSGVAVYTKEKPLSIKKGFGIEKFDNEGRIFNHRISAFCFIQHLLSQWQKERRTPAI